MRRHQLSGAGAGRGRSGQGRRPTGTGGGGAGGGLFVSVMSRRFPCFLLLLLLLLLFIRLTPHSRLIAGFSFPRLGSSVQCCQLFLVLLSYRVFTEFYGPPWSFTEDFLATQGGRIGAPGRGGWGSSYPPVRMMRNPRERERERGAPKRDAEREIWGWGRGLSWCFFCRTSVLL